jgi:hypothetical protein
VTDEDDNAVVSEAYVSQILWFEDKNGNKDYDDGELMTTDYFKQNTAYGVLLGISHRDAEEGFTVDMYNSTVRIAGEEDGMDAIPVTLVTETDASGNAVKTEQVTMFCHVFEATGAAAGVTVSGKVASSGNPADTITVVLMDASGETIVQEDQDPVNDAYKFTGVVGGEYTIRVTKQNHVTRDYRVSVE